FKRLFSHQLLLNFDSLMYASPQVALSGIDFSLCLRCQTQTKGTSDQVGFTAREAAGGVKPGVKRSVTPGNKATNKRRAREAADRRCDNKTLNGDESTVGRSA